MDVYLTTGQGFLGYNMYAYCGNNPVNRNDSSGMLWKEIGDWLKKVGQKIEEFLVPSNIYSTTVGATSISTTALASSLEGAINTAQRPNNIGIGTFAKQCADELQSVSNFSKGASKVLNVVAYGAVGIDVGIGVYDNITSGSSIKKTISDATVDMAITGGSVWAAGSAGSAAGTALGTVFPGVGNVIGAGVGFVSGIGIYILTDMISINGKSARTWVKEGVNGLW